MTLSAGETGTENERMDGWMEIYCIHQQLLLEIFVRKEYETWRRGSHVYKKNRKGSLDSHVTQKVQLVKGAILQ